MPPCKKFEGSFLIYIRGEREIYSSSLVKFEDGKLVCQKPLLIGDLNSPKILLWHYKEHYEPIVKIGVNI